MDRKLDGVCFRVRRGSKWRPVCFSDLTVEERYALFEAPGSVPRSAEWWKSLAYHLADRLRVIGDTFDIVNGE